jgi:protocatechuate 3,4-dioxygenase beta subunit
MTWMTRARRLTTGMAAVGVTIAVTSGQVSREAPANAPASGRLAPVGERGRPLSVSGVVVDDQGAPIAGASLYIYQTDAEGYYGVKPESDSRNPRLRLLLRSGRDGAWSFETIRPGSYPGSRVPGHIHFEVAAAGYAPKIFEIVFEGDPFITTEMRRNPVFSVRPVDDAGRVTDRIVLRRVSEIAPVP